MKKTVVHLTLKSENRKTGPIPVSTSTAAWCPDTCPLKAAGCYAESGKLSLHWQAVTNGERGTDWRTFCAQIASLPDGQLWRHNQAGDLPADRAGRIDVAKLGALIDANRWRRGFTYTHHRPDVAANAALIRYANENGFAVNLSADNVAEADRLAALGIAPVVTLLPLDHGDRSFRSPGGRPVMVCPAVIRDGVTCATCGICAIADRRQIVGFPAHGFASRAADLIARGVS